MDRINFENGGLIASGGAENDVWLDSQGMNSDAIDKERTHA